MKPLQRARNGEGPSLVQVMTSRVYGHFVGDAQTYRPDGEIDMVRADKDCLKIFRKKVVDAGLLTDGHLDEIYNEEKRRVDEATTKAQAAPRPTEADLMADIYVSY